MRPVRTMKFIQTTVSVRQGCSNGGKRSIKALASIILTCIQSRANSRNHSHCDDAGMLLATLVINYAGYRHFRHKVGSVIIKQPAPTLGI